MNQGKLIVATPSILGDFNFRRSVILLASHKNSGSIGHLFQDQAKFFSMVNRGKKLKGGQ